MREVRPGDLILHLVSGEIIGSSLAALDFQEIDQLGRPYYVVKLDGFDRLAKPLSLSDVFERHLSDYRTMAARPGAHLFFGSNLKLRQGAYITPAAAVFLQDVESCCAGLTRRVSA